MAASTEHEMNAHSDFWQFFLLVCNLQDILGRGLELKILQWPHSESTIHLDIISELLGV